MNLTYAWADADQSVIVASDGRSIPADARNAHYAALLAEGASVAAFRRWADLATARLDLKRSVAREADARIDALTSDGIADPARRREQLTAAAVVILEKRTAGETISEGELATEAIARAVQAGSYAIRVAEAVKFAAIDALADLAAADAYDVAAVWA